MELAGAGMSVSELGGHKSVWVFIPSSVTFPAGLGCLSVDMETGERLSILGQLSYSAIKSKFKSPLKTTQ